MQTFIMTNEGCCHDLFTHMVRKYLCKKNYLVICLPNNIHEKLLESAWLRELQFYRNTLPKNEIRL